ncbi:hypothetical protein H2198_002757 [Neophaeococcomyces mojaviensis]|uniref:Uncharacterized protein n=1 Tax=Neophaeococcomyces mojaviensis TaxID=3383035 RepID=A0ACC3ADN5_9EURO|nr:hypothetical protein H2198_002757 [Knufia sp. JES_112]
MSRIASDLASSPHHPLAAEHQNDNTEPRMQRLCIGKLPKVAVVGAGLSGLRCADILTRAGAQVTIFEARSRIGGRVHQVDNGGHLIDVGSNWIHGTEGNPILRLAEKTKTVMMEPEEGSIVVDAKGNRRTEEESGELSADLWAAIVGAFKYSDEHSADIDAKTSLLDYLKGVWAAEYAGMDARLRDLGEESRMWGQFVGSPIDRQSLKYFFLEECLDGENVFVAGTYQKILQQVAKPALAKANIRLGNEVKHVQYRQSDDDSPVKVQLADGAEHDFDEVVVTCPLGWLKRNKASAFTPSLPPQLSNAIGNIGYGALEKLYITFPQAFWLGTELPSANSFQTPSFPCFIHFHNPTYHPDPASKSSTSWNQSVVSLAHLPPSTAQPTLLFYMHGDCGAHLTNQLQPYEPHSATYNYLLQSFAEPFYSRLPNFDPEAEACKPTLFYLTSWQTDSFAGYGSYCCFQTGLAEGDKDIEVMRKTGGLSDEGKGLWLAGEHTAPFVALGTTTGAWWSGEGVARRIAKQYGLTITEEELDGTVEEVETSKGRAPGEVSERTVGKNMNGNVLGERANGVGL